jgi:hypothetical protein
MTNRNHNGNSELAHADIAERAHQIWTKKGHPPNSAEADWLEAERELHDALLSRRLTQLSDEKSGSVQS